MRIRAAVMHAPGRPLEVEELELASPGPDEVRVQILATGICRSDLSYLDGKWPAPLPIVLGPRAPGGSRRWATVSTRGGSAKLAC